MMAIPIINFSFTAEEVNQCIVFHGDPPIAALMKRTDPPAEGKKPYSKLLVQKIAEAVPKSSRFRVHEAFKEAGVGFMRCYMLCGHGEKMPVTFVRANLLVDHELNFAAEIKCLPCMGREPVLVADVVAQNPAAAVVAQNPVAAIQVPAIPAIAINAPNELTDILLASSSRVTAVMTHVNSFCSAEKSPLRIYTANKARFGIMLLDAFNDDGLPPPRERSRTRSRSRSNSLPPQVSPPARRRSGRSEFNSKLSKAMKDAQAKQKKKTAASKNK